MSLDYVVAAILFACMVTALYILWRREHPGQVPFRRPGRLAQADGSAADDAAPDSAGRSAG